MAILVQLVMEVRPGRKPYSGEWRCGRVQPNGRLRVAVPSDKGHRLELSFYAGPLASKEREGCVALMAAINRPFAPNPAMEKAIGAARVVRA